ncbi:chorismate lyase [Acaryochloris marina S15]|nr:chorismate lyase [Acaryochloris marina S15]
MRTDLQQTFSSSHIEPSKLSTFQRILLTTDGTVTDILEAYAFEQIQIVKLSESLFILEDDINSMKLKKGSEVIARKILLQGKISRKNFVYAESIIAPENLNIRFREALLKTKSPIGKLWFEQRVETFKEIVNTSIESATNLSKYFNIGISDKLFSRTYQVFTDNKPVMMITEKFPESYFTDLF